MNKTNKKIISFFVATALVISSLVIPVFGASNVLSLKSLNSVKFKSGDTEFSGLKEAKFNVEIANASEENPAIEVFNWEIKGVGAEKYQLVTSTDALTIFDLSSDFIVNTSEQNATITSQSALTTTGSALITQTTPGGLIVESSFFVMLKPGCVASVGDYPSIIGTSVSDPEKTVTIPITVTENYYYTGSSSSSSSSNTKSIIKQEVTITYDNKNININIVKNKKIKVNKIAMKFGANNEIANDSVICLDASDFIEWSKNVELKGTGAFSNVKSSVHFKMDSKGKLDTSKLYITLSGIKGIVKENDVLYFQGLEFTANKLARVGKVEITFISEAIKSQTIQVATLLDKIFVNAKLAVGSKVLTVNGKTIQMDVAPYVKDGNTMMPVFYVANSLGVDSKDITWDDTTKTVIIINGEDKIEFVANTYIMRINGKKTYTQTKNTLKDGRAFITIKDIEKAFKLQVDSDSTPNLKY